MDLELERAELQRAIIELDRQMAEEVGGQARRIPSLRVRDYSFPWGIWILTALCFAWWAFGSMFFAQLAPVYFRVGFYVGLLGVAIGVWKTIVWVWRNIRLKTIKPSHTEDETDRLRGLRQEKRRIMERLEQIKKTQR